MSREIRFRFWDTEEGKWLGKESSYWKELTFEDCRKKLIASMRQGNIVAEQYTGLKDKNGKEIYEGDILQIDDHILGDFEVIWHNLGWKIKRSVGYESLSVHKSEDCTVIGNIHENQELLEVNNGQ